MDLFCLFSYGIITGILHILADGTQRQHSDTMFIFQTEFTHPFVHLESAGRVFFPLREDLHRGYQHRELGFVCLFVGINFYRSRSLLGDAIFTTFAIID
jgi:hypothetical protein